MSFSYICHGHLLFIWLRFLVRFSRALSYDVGVYILYDHPDFLSAKNGAVLTETLQRLYKNRTVIVQSSRYPFINVRCPCDVNAGSLRLSQEPTIILLSKFLWCPHDQRAVPVRRSCDQPAMYLQAKGLRFFSKFVRVRRGYDARESVR